MKTGKHRIGSSAGRVNGNGHSPVNGVGAVGLKPADQTYRRSEEFTVPVAGNGHRYGDLDSHDARWGAAPASTAAPTIAGPSPGTGVRGRARGLERRAATLLRRRLPKLTDLGARAILCALCLVLVAALAGVAVAARAYLAKPPGVVATTAGPSVISNQPGGVGTLAEAPNNSFTVSLNLAGIQDAIFSISQVDVTDGALVGVGTPLVQIDPTLLVQNAAQFQSQLASAEQSLTQAEQAPASSQADAQSQAQQVAALSEQVAYDRELVAVAQGTTTTLTSPTSGYVTGLNVQPGQVVGAGQPILEVINPSVVDVSASLLLSDISTIAPGDSADVAPTGLPGVHLHGKVLTVSAISSGGGLDGTVVIQAQNTSPDPVPIGTQVFVHVTATQSAAVSVPEVAVMDSDLEPAVFVLHHGRVYFQPVTLGASDSSRDQIVSGLRSGEVVVESNMQSLTDGERVHVLGS